MRTEEYACDRCGQRADGAVSVYWYELPLRQAHDLTVVDLCPACAEELRAWLMAETAGEGKEDRR